MRDLYALMTLKWLSFSDQVKNFVDEKRMKG